MYFGRRLIERTWEDGAGNGHGMTSTREIKGTAGRKSERARKGH